MGNGNPIVTRFLWTGHSQPSDKRSSGSTGAPAYIVNMMPQYIVDTNTGNTLPAGDIRLTREPRYTLLHETAHQFDAPNHYCREDKGSNGKCSRTTCYDCYKHGSATCAMTIRLNIETTPNSNLFCTSCDHTTRRHLLNHH